LHWGEGEPAVVGEVLVFLLLLLLLLLLLKLLYWTCLAYLELRGCASGILFQLRHTICLSLEEGEAAAFGLKRGAAKKKNTALADGVYLKSSNIVMMCR